MLYAAKPYRKTLETRPRETLEIIVDTCSLGKPQLDGISKLITYVMGATPRIFNNYQIIIPIQIAAEARQRIFPEFLDAELMLRDKQNHLDAFYRKHRTHAKIVETATSRGFTFFYAKKAAAIIEREPALAKAIAEEATKLITRYNPILSGTTKFTAEEVQTLCRSIQEAGEMHEERMEQSKNNVRTRALSKQEHRDNASPHHIERKSTARHGSRFLETTTWRQHYLLQAMYSLPPLYKSISLDKDFARFRKDKGERAIENYLFDNRSETNPQCVSLVISDDMGARTSIQHLRSHSHNTVFTVSSWGLALALKQLRLIPSLDAIVAPNILRDVGTRHQKTAQKLRDGHLITMNDIKEPRIERKWAYRLVQVLKYGHWDAREKGHEAIAR